MLLLTSVNDRLQIITSSAATINVHASWVDTLTGTITPGRTNTAISAAATTSVAGAPVASAQRNIKTLHVRNTHATLACDVTIQHTDGTIVSQLYKVTLAADDQLEYTDQNGFVAITKPPPALPTAPITRVFGASGTYVPTAGMTYIVIELVGGGGGGGHVNGNVGISTAAGGGGAGGYARKTATAAAVGASQPVTIGGGGTSTQPGGTTAVGGLCAAGGGGAGGHAIWNLSAVGEPGLGGWGTAGDVLLRGGSGMGGAVSGAYFDSTPFDGGGPDAGSVNHGGDGGDSQFGGGGNGYANQNGSDGVYGGGGGGAQMNNTVANPIGGNGGAGLVIITEHFV